MFVYPLGLKLHLIPQILVHPSKSVKDIFGKFHIDTDAKAAMTKIINSQQLEANGELHVNVVYLFRSEEEN